MKKIFKLLLVVILIAIVIAFIKPRIGNVLNDRDVDVPNYGVSNLIDDVKDNIEIPDIPELPNLSDVISTQNPEPVERENLAGPYAVVRVVDGDTAIINIDGTEKRVRFIGVDTPESVNPDESKNTEEGKIASDYTKKLLTGKSVYLEYDVTKEDDYGRTLAYIYLDDGETMVEDLLLSNGLATTLTIQPNSKYADHFHQLQVEAREAGAGFWETGFFG